MSNKLALKATGITVGGPSSIEMVCGLLKRKCSRIPLLLGLALCSSVSIHMCAQHICEMQVDGQESTSNCINVLRGQTECGV